MLKLNRIIFCPVFTAPVRTIKGHPPYVHPNPLVQPIPTRRKFKSKVAIAKFRDARGRKVAKIELPDFHEKKEMDMTPDEVRAKMKKLGMQPIRSWDEKPIFISSTGGTFEPYVPPEGDGKAAFVSKEGAKQKFEFLDKKRKSMLTIRKIRQYEEEFDRTEFCEEAQKIYVNMHEALVKFDEKELHKLVTERAYPLVVSGAKNKSIRWAFHGSLEPPRIVHARQSDIVTADNIFAQITVRFHTQQTLAVYDRFGRLIHGSEIVLRDLLEYIVFEKQISNTYGKWRVHDKIIPEWMNLKPVSMFTFKVEKEKEPDSTKSTELTVSETERNKTAVSNPSSIQV